MIQKMFGFFHERYSEFSEWLTALDAGDVLVAAVLVVVSFLFRKRVAFVVVQIMRFVLKRFELNIPERTEQSLTSTLGIAVVAFGCLIAAEMLGTALWFDGIGRNGLASIGVFAIFAAISQSLDALKTQKSRLTDNDGRDYGWMVQVARVFLSIAALAIVLEIWGIDATTLLASLSALGAAIAYIMRTALTGLVAGVVTREDQRFKIGDYIKVEGFASGTVEEIGLQATVIRQFDLGLVWIPNAALIESALINYSRRPHRRIYWTIGLELETTASQLREIRDQIEAFLRSDPDYATKDASLIVRIEGFSETATELMIYCFTTQNVWELHKEAQEKLALKVKEIVETEGARFAVPARAIHMREGPGIGSAPHSAGGN